ncbi:MAG: Asp-tRNA(Asn)/Glu-tRNA(Gln) amidotransferase subunit GatA [Alphaproteobacteria bacterium]|nr:MAG: Asp-tRNA(Asn)/Glu-tRNA(Gln) amidotransferase subunit GatA [Alphaproteobacteria bacterium]TAF14803.1 MAG: Asp-tRNA(Asn)/Glu-tRNA(Gln) amidotransferase subunit GatA [Alphaproteobacteria bacterium]TAF40552.1 MAG: Asp-tRNA(Asn)/Glu-tRNA(Gln) amidotransferase subunit GatA [Alphaproteobacteria bacterium]
MSQELRYATIAQLKTMLATKQVSAREITDAYLDAIEASNPKLNAFITITAEQARAQADAADARIAQGEARALEGIPIAIKDLFCTKGVQTTAASHMLEGFIPTYESTVTQRLYDAGMVGLGKTNLDQFAMGSANITSYFGNVLNPWGENLVPGGSSGGSATAVSANLCAASLGTDTGGSIRQPAAFSGIVGLKPTYGRCSRYGIIAFASSLDQAGPITKTVEDAAILFEIMAGHDEKDSTSAHHEIPNVSNMLEGDMKGLRVGIPLEYRPDGLDAEIAAMWDHGVEILRARGAEIVPISLKHTKYALPTYYIIAPAEASSNLARYDGVRYGLRVHEAGMGIDDLYECTRSVGFGAEVKRRIMIGTYVLSAGYYDAYYKKAQRVRGCIINDFREAFEKVDVILTPTAPSAAFKIGEKMDDPVTMYLNDVFTVPASMAGIPAMAIPAGLNKAGLPLGLQLLGRSFDEVTLFKVAAAMERDLGFVRLKL